MMREPNVKYLKDYRPPEYRVDTIHLEVDLHEDQALVRSKLAVRRNTGDEKTPLVLDGQDLSLVSLALDGIPLSPGQYRVDNTSLTIPDVPEKFTLESLVRMYPQTNTSLEGLYKSGNMFCTQCEAEGFRKITWFPDRPDVMAKFTCTITADKSRYPVLLSNGNLVGSEDLGNGRHRVTWEDPFKKPCYLFALVAGDLTCIEDAFRTCSGRNVILRIYVEESNADKCGHAMQSLKKAMKWDEEVFGREYDLDIYMIVAVNDFNMGAMENKGLNIFNAKYVLARPDTATDADFWGIERVIAHEYFHNWTGNRITLRNWFQLSLKEGLTVFRDQEFSADMTSRPVKRIGDVRSLRTYQFPEDAGPSAHPVRPGSYIKMDNFYTATVYEKGAEIIRILQTLLGREMFRKGMDLYFQRHDGQAVTLEEFVGAMSDTAGVNLEQFMLWYSQAGTPVVMAVRRYDPQNQTYTLTFSQKCPSTPDMSEKKPMHIPIAVGLLDKTGKSLPLQLKGESEPEGMTRVLHLNESQQTFEFIQVPHEPVPSILREFSAPVKLRAGYTDEERVFLFANDSDPFNRWDAGQNLFSKIMLNLVDDFQAGRELHLLHTLIDAFRKTLLSQEMDRSFISQALTLPTEPELAILMSENAPIDPEAIHQVRQFVTRGIAETLRPDFEKVFMENQEKGPYSLDPESVGRRSLKNLALAYLGRIDSPETSSFVSSQFKKAGNMTDEISAFSVLSFSDTKEWRTAVARFYDRWHSDVLVLDKWFSIQASAPQPGTLEQVKGLLTHPDFSIKNPNKVRSLIGTFCSGNPWNFHHPSGHGYEFLTDRILELNTLNPQVAARMSSGFNHWKRYEPIRRELMKAQLDRIMNAPNLSSNVYEIVSKALS
jgi:aminopeptidase N